MPSITLSQIANGTPGDATPVNGNFTTIANALNGNLDDSNVKTAAGIQGSKLLDGTYARALAFVPLTSNFSTSSSSAVQVTGATAAVTVPTLGANHYVEIEAYFPSVSNTALAFDQISLWDGAVGSGTQLQSASIYESITTATYTGIVKAIVSPAAGGKTYNVGVSANTGTVTLGASATAPAYLVVKII